MSSCYVCGSEMADEARSCPVCGTAVEAGPPLSPPDSGLRACPACGQRYDPDYPDSFCACGTALVADSTVLPDIDLEPARAAEDLPLEREGPPAEMAGPRLVVYSADREPIHTLLLDRDVTRIGRTDPVRGDFVELDVGGLFDGPTARKVSRKHCLVLRSRETHTFTLRPLAGNTGTQVDNELAAELTDCPLTDGTRIVLGGVVRIKFVVS